MRVLSLKKIYLGTLLLLAVPLFSQNSKSYKDLFLDGVYFLDEENFTSAITSFSLAYSLDSSNANINFNLGFAYLNSITKKSKALYYLTKAAENVSKGYRPFNASETKAPPITYYYLGVANRINYNFEDAIKSFTKYKTFVGSSLTKSEISNVEREIKMCKNAISFYAEAPREKEESKNVMKDSVNSPFPDYSPVISADESTLIFTSRRPSGTGEDLTPEGDYYEDIYISKKDETGKWTAPKSIGNNINTPGHEATVSLSPNGDQLLIYKDDGGDGNIYISNLVGDNWSIPQKLGSDINSTYWEPSACISPDGSVLYFVSNRPGGFGGRDIYRCVKLPNGEWSMATNLGPTINTEFDEDAPFMHPDGVTLFFSSNGHKSIGGFDVFFTTKKENWKWTPPINAGKLINTPDDDIYYVLSPDGKRAYYSSAKKGGNGEKDIYMLAVEQSLVEPTTLLRGYITFDGKAKTPSDVNVRITAVDVQTDVVTQEIKPNSVTGKYVVILNPGQTGKTYRVVYEATGFNSIVDTIKVMPESEFFLIDRLPVNFESKKLGTIAVTGIVTDLKTSKPIPNVKIVIKNNATGEVKDSYFVTSNKGVYYFVLPRGENYNISYEAQGYLFQSENVFTPKDSIYQTITKNIALSKIEVGAKMVLNNIFFDVGMATLRKESNIELEKLYVFMVDNPDMIVEISGHTDDQGTDEINIPLSQNRAQAVVDYLTNDKNKIYRVAPYYYKGVPKNRLVAKGYSSTMPIAPNRFPNGDPDPEARQLNRRVEFKIISTSGAEILKSR